MNVVGSYGEFRGRKKNHANKFRFGVMMGLVLNLPPERLFLLGGKYIIPQLNPMVN